MNSFKPYNNSLLINIFLCRYTTVYCVHIVPIRLWYVYIIYYVRAYFNFYKMTWKWVLHEIIYL